MARFVVSAVAAVAVGFVTGSPQAGFATFSAVYGVTGFLDPNQQVSGPRIDDLKGTTAEYGTPIPHVYGHPRVAGTIVWCSDKREIATTEEAGGKGGPSTDVTTYTYEIDLRIILTANEIAGVRRIWSNGKLVWSSDAEADAETIAASAETNSWRRITVYGGAADQMPDPTEEAALGIANCPAYRGRGSVFIEGLNLGGSGFLPNLTFEVMRLATSEPGDVFWLLNFPSSPFEDESSWGNEVESLSMVLGTPAAFGGGAAVNEEILGSSGFGVFADALSVPWDPNTEDLTMESRVYIGSDINSTIAFCRIATDGGFEIFFGIVDFTSPNERQLQLVVNGEVAAGILYTAPDYPVGFGYLAAEVGWDAQSRVAVGFINGQPVLQVAYSGTPPSAQDVTFVAAGYNSSNLDPIPAGQVAVDGVRFTRRRMRHSVAFTPDITAPTDDSGLRYTAFDEPLDDVLTDISTRAGVTATDFSSCSSQSVRAIAVTQVTPARTVMELLGSGALQEFVEGSGIKTVARGGASVATLDYDELGASTGDLIEALPLKRLNDIELPAQFAITYVNVLNDYQKGTEYSDRLLGGSTSIAATELAIGLTPTEAKRLADVRLLDAVAGIIQVGPVNVTRAWAALEPTDVITLTGHDGSTFRSRILKITDAGGLRTLECILDDATVINSSAETDDDYESSSIVRALVGTNLELLDIPILRDADNNAGIYAAVNRATLEGDWPGAALFRGVNEAGWAQVASFTDRTFIGVTTTDLAPWTGGYVFDETGTVTVSGVGTLSNYTDDAILNGTADGYLIGSEVLYAKRATLVSTGVYTLAGLLRGRRGTEWAAAEGAETGTRVVLLRASGIRRVGFENGQLGTEFDFRAVTFGNSIGSALNESLTPMGIGLKPFAPVHVEADDNGDGTYDVTWQRRTRLSCRFVGSLGINTPLGESSESYAVEVFDGASVTSTQTVSDESATVTASPGDTVRVYQISAIVGRGYVAELEL